MKFGRNLPRNQVPEWSNSYINYKALKKLIKDALEKQKRTGELDLTPFFYSLDRNLETIDTFFNKKLAEYSRRLKLLQSRYSPENPINPTIPEGLDRNELQELVGALLELRSGLRKVSWYGEVNRRGFVKILKKVDKKTNVCAQKQYLDTKVMSKSFADAREVENAKSTVNMWLSKAGEAEMRLVKEDEEKKTDCGSVSPGTNRTDFKTKRLLMKRVPSSSLNGIPEGMVDTVDQCLREDNPAILEEVLLETSALVKNYNALSESQLEEDPITQQLLLNLLQRAISSRPLACIKFLLGRVDCLHEEDDIHERNILHRLVLAIARPKSIANASSAIVTAFGSTGLNSNNLNGQSKNLNSIIQFAEPPFFLTPAQSPITTPSSVHQYELDGTIRLDAHDDSVTLLRFILEHLRESQRSALLAKDTYGRMSLHYAAQYGFLVICQVLIKHMKEWGQYDVEDGIDSQKWQDNDGLAPLHLAVMNGHPKTTRFLLQSYSWGGCVGVVPMPDEFVSERMVISKTSAVLQIAVRGSDTINAKSLIDAGANLDYQNEHGETALHIAARLGHTDCVRLLLQGCGGESAEVEIPEYAYGWTPLFSAAAEGQLDVVKLLVEEARADVMRPDSSGWTAIEHAALRGHLDIVQYLKEKVSVDFTPQPSDTSSVNDSTNGFSTPVPVGSPAASAGKSSGSFNLPSSYSSSSGSPPNPSYLMSKITASNTEAIKSFGHRYLKPGTTMILVTIGSNDTRKTRPAVNLDHIPLAHAHSTQLDTALSLVISAKHAKGEPIIIDLPVQHSASTDELIVFETDTKDLNRVQLRFDIVPTYSGRPDQKIGRAVALMSSIRPPGGKVSLHGGVQAPILSANMDAEVIGTVDFEFLIINSFEHQRLGVTGRRTYWKSVTGPQVIGHRGLGKNRPSRKSLQLGENTIQSFIAAANLGASYVEFDVQLTKDHVPVIYHDFCVCETGIDAPVHTLTLEQFLSVSEHTSPKASRPESPNRFGRIADKFGANDRTNVASSGSSSRPNPPHRRARSMSLNSEEGQENSVQERLKYTRNYKLGKIKGNSRGASIQGPFTTLEEVFKRLPLNLGFNIELKYPMLQESEEEEMDMFGIEMNTWVDTVLKVVYDHGKERDIIFSSFNPDICLMLSFKQPSIPILFLTEGGTQKMADVRASSLQEAIRFASRWNLLGIVSAAEPLVMCPRLIKIVKESGLVCVTYGALNNLTENVKLQVDQGVDAVIVDSVLAIRKGLTAAEKRKELTAVTANAAELMGNKVEESKKQVETVANGVI